MSQSDVPHSLGTVLDETQPLLPDRPQRKRFYRARPLWIVPFATVAALIRGMTLATRVQIFTQIACASVHSPYEHTGSEVLTLIADQCSSDPRVQSQAAILQSTTTLTMGLLAALSTSRWGALGERFGRTKVLAIAEIGLIATDAAFLFSSYRPSPSLAKLVLYLAVAVEGLFGGWSSLQSTLFAYLADCTSSTSRAKLFSLFTGMLYIGFSFGPIFTATILRWRASVGESKQDAVTWVFMLAAITSTVNMLFALLVIPESKKRGTDATPLEEPAPMASKLTSAVMAPISIFLPFRPTPTAPLQKSRRDWSMSFLGLALLGYLIIVGVYPIKYLYASLVFDWGPEQISYFITALGSLRAIYLTVIFPSIISLFKPKRKPSTSTETPTLSQIRKELKFDLFLTRLSFVFEFTSHFLIVILPANNTHLFVMANMFSSFGSAVSPSINSLALSILNARATSEGTGPVDVGKLFGAVASMTALGGMLLGPLIFGSIYASTVAFYPRAIFIMGSLMSLICLGLMLLVRVPGSPKKAQLDRLANVERGRSRRSKDLRKPGNDGAPIYIRNSDASPSTPSQGTPSE